MSSSEQTPPVSTGEELDVRVESVGEKGDGIVRKQGFVLFVPGVSKGEEIRIKVKKVLAKVGFAEKTGPAQGPVINPPREKKRRGHRPQISDEDIKSVLEDKEPEITQKDSSDFGADLDDDEW